MPQQLDSSYFAYENLLKSVTQVKEEDYLGYVTSNLEILWSSKKEGRLTSIYLCLERLQKCMFAWHCAYFT